jgi:hypothetical protein
MTLDSIIHRAIRPGPGPNVILPLCGYALLGCFVTLYVLNPRLYSRVLDLWSFYPYRHPFLDIEWFGAVTDCLRLGVDVYAANPCDELGRVFNYSPVWLWLSFWPTSKAWTYPLGLSVDGLFILSMALLPRPRRPRDHRPLLLCLLSPMTFYALERANIDLVIFVSVLVAVVCMEHGLITRIPGYGVILVAALLKFYPLGVMLLLLRERLRVALPLVVISISVVVAFVWTDQTELLRMMPNIPRPSIFGGAFGAVQLPVGLAVLLNKVFALIGLEVGGRWVGGGRLAVIVFLVLMCGFSLLGSVRLADREDFRIALDHTTQREHLCLVAGAILVCGCFFTGRNSGYREIYIMMVVPGLLAMARSASSAGLARIFRVAGGVALFLMWFPVPMRVLNSWFRSIDEGGSPEAWFFWIGREVAWWWFIAVLAAVLVRFILDSPMWQEATALLRQRRRPATPP